jgi:hypothetical protein
LPCTAANAVDITTDPLFQSNLTTQRNKIVKDLEPARFYPIINAGVSYRF